MKQKENSVKSLLKLLKSNLSEKILSKRKIDGNEIMETSDADFFSWNPSNLTRLSSRDSEKISIMYQNVLRRESLSFLLYRLLGETSETKLVLMYSVKE